MEQILIISSILLWALVLFNLLLSVAVIRRLNNRSLAESGREFITMEIGDTAPAFTAETLEGKKVTLADYAHQAVAFIFTSDGCSVCKEKLPTYESLLSKAREAGIELVLVSVDDKRTTQTVVENFNVTLPVLVAPTPGNPFMKDYKIPGTPYYCLINEQGVVEGVDFFDTFWDWEIRLEQRKASMAFSVASQ